MSDGDYLGHDFLGSEFFGGSILAPAAPEPPPEEEEPPTEEERMERMRERCPITVLAPDGKPLAGAHVEVKHRLSGAVATVYTTETGEVVAANPATTDAHGKVNVWGPRGAYNCVVTHEAIEPYTEPWDASPAEDGAIDEPWLAEPLRNLLAELSEQRPGTWHALTSVHANLEKLAGPSTVAVRSSGGNADMRGGYAVKAGKEVKAGEVIGKVAEGLFPVALVEPTEKWEINASGEILALVNLPAGSIVRLTGHSYPII